MTEFKPDGEGQGKLIVVSNREPYLHKRSGSDVSVEIPAGGLTSAMDDVLRKTGGTWVAWGSGEADRESVDSNDCVAVPPDMPAYTLKRVWLSDDEAENYYHGYANQVLWPLCHITLDRVNYMKRFWQDYTKANEAFARAVLEEAGEGSTVWVHDYHLCLVPRILRERRPGLTIIHFWHIPWPDWGVFKVCPQAREILEGLLGNDLIGFQIPLFVKNFMDCVSGCLNAEIDYQSATVRYAGHTTRLEAFPISIDAEKFSSLASSSRTVGMMEDIRLRHRLDKVKVGIGVDRLEYTKALIKRLQAINLFFERYPEFRERFTFIQIAVATRMREPYISYEKAVEEMISAVNERYSTDGWIPVVYLDEKVEQKDLVAYYRMADIAIISSVYDGMNLVAKEYAASQVDGSGVLILSELAGAAEDLEGALLVNPYDSEGFSDLIHKALMMPDKEKKERMSSLREQVRDNDISLWMSRILHELTEIESIKRPADDRLCEPSGNLRDPIAGRDIFLFLDYDGTLAPIADFPDEAFMPQTIRSLLEEVSENIPVAIVSGRSLMDLRERVALDGIVCAGNHGAEIWDGERVIEQELSGGRAIVTEIAERLRQRVAHIPGALIENKGITASLHYRNVDPLSKDELLDLFRNIAGDYRGLVRITRGKMVLEVRPLHAWNKGDAVLRIMDAMGKGRLPIYIGDDTTDEDAYRAIRGKGISVSVGYNSEADYHLESQEEIGGFLSLIREEAGIKT